MGQSATGGSNAKPQPRGEVIQLGDEDKIVLTKVEVIRQREVIKIPELVTEIQKTVKYETVQEPTVKYVVSEEPTVKYNVDERETTNYITREEETVKYNVKEVLCERPVLVEKVYERPVLQEKEYTLVTYNDIEAIRELMELAPKLLEQLKQIRNYQIVEEVIKVPKISYVPTDVYRITKTGELIKDAD